MGVSVCLLPPLVALSYSLLFVLLITDQSVIALLSFSPFSSTDHHDGHRYGYRGKDCRHNLYLLPTGEIVFFIAAVVVLYNIDDQIQRHYNGHTGEIRCLTIHPNRLLIATGQTLANNER